MTSPASTKTTIGRRIEAKRPRVTVATMTGGDIRQKTPVRMGQRLLVVDEARHKLGTRGQCLRHGTLAHHLLDPPSRPRKDVRRSVIIKSTALTLIKK